MWEGIHSMDRWYAWRMFVRCRESLFPETTQLPIQDFGSILTSTN
jgi:hypothetical protein